jgi:5'(3')-deoxyribonucleotidase
MDAIVADLATPWYARWNERTGASLSIDTVEKWDLAKTTGDGRIYEILREPGLYRDLPPIQPAIEVIKGLTKWRVGGELQYEVFILTAAISDPQIIPDKIHWLERHMPFIDRKHMAFVYHKHIVRGDVLIDDAPKNLKRWAKNNPGGLTATVTYPYNKDANVDIRGNDYKNMEEAWKSIDTSLRMVRFMESE